MRLAICIGTFRRGALLRLLLNGIAQLKFRKVSMPDIEVIVVDNDMSRTAQEVCQQASLPWPIRCVTETRRGITPVRNRGIAEAGGVDFIVFIDDDEVPVAQWLDELLWTQKRFRADVVTGPVLPRFEPNVTEWIREGGFFDGCKWPTGSLMDFCATGNVLIRGDVLSRVSAFDESFALSGGEDTQFFLRVLKTGHKIVWSQEAVVYEAISTSRANVDWILRRAYQIGNRLVFCESSVDDRVRIRMMRFVKACGHIVKGSVNVLISIFSGKAAILSSLQPLCRGLGMLAGLAGWRYLAYQSEDTCSTEQ